MQLAGGPVSGKGTGMQQGFEHADHPVVVQLQAGHASVSDQRRFGQSRQLPGIDGTGQEVSLQCQAAFVGRRQLVAQQWQVLQSPPHAKVAGIVRAGLIAQDAIGLVVVTTRVLFGE